MKQREFEARLAGFWAEYDNLVDGIETADAARAYDLPKWYRRTCSHYALARARYYSPLLVGRLQHSVRGGHDLLYRQDASWLWRLLTFLWFDFPGQVRTNYKYVCLSLALLLLPAAAMGIGTWHDGELIFSVLPGAQVESIEASYDPANKRIGVGAERRSDTDFKMFGYYIYNNISIGLRCFAMGILFGVGTVFSVVYNGVLLGAVAGHLTRIGDAVTFWPFVCGHSALELTAIVISGAAGLRLARPLLSPGQLARMEALKAAGRESVQMAMGAVIMFVIAAWIEAFWSSSTLVPIPLKLAAAATLWTLVISYLLNAGRGNHGR